jgi:hypothetical protein
LFLRGLFTFGLRLRPDVSPLGMAITVAALIAMPILSRLKPSAATKERNGED